MKYQTIAAAIVINAPGFVIRWGRPDDVRRLEREHDLFGALPDDAFAVVTASKVRFINIGHVGESGLPVAVGRPVLGALQSLSRRGGFVDAWR